MLARSIDSMRRCCHSCCKWRFLACADDAMELADALLYTAAFAEISYICYLSSMSLLPLLFPQYPRQRPHLFVFYSWGSLFLKTSPQITIAVPVPRSLCLRRMWSRDIYSPLPRNCPKGQKCPIEKIVIIQPSIEMSITSLGSTSCTPTSSPLTSRPSYLSPEDDFRNAPKDEILDTKADMTVSWLHQQQME